MLAGTLLPAIKSWVPMSSALASRRSSSYFSRRSCFMSCTLAMSSWTRVVLVSASPFMSVLPVASVGNCSFSSSWEPMSSCSWGWI
jgi:hypothetical protein